MCQVSHNPLRRLDLSYSFKPETFHSSPSSSLHDNDNNRSVGIEIIFKEHACTVISVKTDGCSVQTMILLVNQVYM